MGENDFRKSFSPKPACLAAMENEIFRKFTSCWPKFTPLTQKWFYTLIFTSNHFRVTQNTERVRERTQREREKEQYRESERKNNIERARERTQREREKEQHRESENQNAPFDPANEWKKEPKLRSSKRVRERTKALIQPPISINLTPVMPSSARWSPRQMPQTHGEWELKLTPIQTKALNPAQPVNHRSSHSNHRAKQTHGEFSGTDWPSTHSPHLRPTHVRSTHSPHRSTPSSRPTSRSDLCIIYIYIYIFIYLYKYLYIYLYKYLYIYLLFFIIHVLLNCVFMGYAYEILELFWLQVIQDWFLVWFFLEFWSLIGFAVIYFRIGLCIWNFGSTHSPSLCIISIHAYVFSSIYMCICVWATIV